jgi:hypothetical protein
MIPAALLLAACNARGPTGPEPVQNLPPTFRLTASASGSDAGAGLTGTCSLDWIFELRREVSRQPTLVQYEGVHGGEASRTVLQSDQSGFGFFIDVFGDVDARLNPVLRTVELRIPINETADSRFYRELALFTGTVDEAGFGSGTWVCAPLDLDQGGYVDTILTMIGTWQIAPATP